MSLPFTASAQNLAIATDAIGPASTTAAAPAVLSTAVALTRSGSHSSVAHALVQGIEVVDEQRVDVDGDGDLDALLMVDLVASETEPKPDLGRGVVIAYRNRHGWRAETIASIPVYPVEAAYNWGPVETLRPGTPPLLHVLFSAARAGSMRQSDTVVHYDHGGLRAVYTNTVDSLPGAGERAVSRSLAVQASDVNGDGVSELLERIAEGANCHTMGCVGPDGAIESSVTRRVLRWDAGRTEFVDDATLLRHHRDAVRTLDDAFARWRSGDLAARDSGIARAYTLDPLDARVRMAFARMALRNADYANAHGALAFAWPQGFGQEARLLQAEAAARLGSADCRSYLNAVSADDPERGPARAARLSRLSESCRR